MLKPCIPPRCGGLSLQPPSGGCVLKHFWRVTLNQFTYPATFGRLCVETVRNMKSKLDLQTQPPSGGCVLKPAIFDWSYHSVSQPPSGGCVLKRCKTSGFCCVVIQPPSGGCVLKHIPEYLIEKDCQPATFGRLCVETQELINKMASGERQPPSGGCVLKHAWSVFSLFFRASRLRAAVC